MLIGQKPIQNPAQMRGTARPAGPAESAERQVASQEPGETFVASAGASAAPKKNTHFRDALFGSMMAGGLALGGLLIGGPAGLVMSAGAVVVAAINLGGALAPMFKGSKKAAAKAPAAPSTPPPSNRPASRPASPGPTVRQSVNANTLKASSHMDMGNGFSVEGGPGRSLRIWAAA